MTPPLDDMARAILPLLSKVESTAGEKQARIMAGALPTRLDAEENSQPCVDLLSLRAARGRRP